MALVSTLISLHNVGKSFDGGKTFATYEIDLEIREGEFFVLLGASGSGKSITLRMINRMVEPTVGEIQIEGKNILGTDPVALRRSIGFVLEKFGLFPHLNVEENIEIVPVLLGWDRQRVKKRIHELMDQLHLPPNQFLTRSVNDLTHGQSQRVALARALAARPRIMLMDEPFALLDQIAKIGLHEEYKDLHKELGLTSILATHDMTEALIMADRIAILKDGKISQVGTPGELLERPANDYVAKLMASPKKQAEVMDKLASSARNLSFTL